MFKTADLCDRFDGKIEVAAPVFQAYGGNIAFSGTIRTVKVHEDNVLVKQMLSSPGNGSVLVIDGGASLHCALVGDQLAAMANDNDWSGLVVNGCIRDSEAINKTAVGVRALATHPRRSIKKGAGDVDIPVRFAGVLYVPGHHIYIDEDGIVISAASLVS
ncbi:MAG: ribonuclease E activity regulator RraA [Burkholderiales bacterium]|nr:ribonuclease E activity regulator RraA [Burkholderiales bacterium]MDQ3195492.1 ribonuclease E activity regulator RraA [Pseudomonadota bacterium]